MPSFEPSSCDIEPDGLSVGRGRRRREEAAVRRPDVGRRGRPARFLGAAPPPGEAPHRYMLVVHALDTPGSTSPRRRPSLWLGFRLVSYGLARSHARVRDPGPTAERGRERDCALLAAGDQDQRRVALQGVPGDGLHQRGGGSRRSGVQGALAAGGRGSPSGAPQARSRRVPAAQAEVPRHVDGSRRRPSGSGC
ncbi:hypothetical protein [Streptomyces sp. NPDC056626]|uniref:hypothetical protein n=1 Tax=unclassified Streptomyces TaxID=2593676 RepID=UPI0036967BF0